ncbi:MAG: endonuclease domain-containing protein [Pseudonocardiaceae bacterium]
MLRGSRYHRLFHDIYLLASAPADLATRSRGAFLLASRQCVLSGYSAAELLGAGCTPADTNAELTVPGGYFREQPGLTIHRDRLADDEILDVGGVLVTTALRTAWDLARWLPTVEAVVAMDALARVGRFAPAAVIRIQDRYPRARWRRRVPGVVDLADPRAESPMETRSRLVLVLRGLPRPELQYQVYDERGEFIARLDLAYPLLKLAIEYDGRGHLTAWQQQADARRLNRLDACGWSVLRFTSPDVLRTPDAMAAQVRQAIARRSRGRSMS